MGNQVRFNFPLYTLTKGISLNALSPIQMNGADHLAIFTSTECARSFLELSKLQGVGVARIDTADDARKVIHNLNAAGEPFTDFQLFVDPVSTGDGEFMSMGRDEFLNALTISSTTGKL
ncbi:hypothetical protein [Lacipirellula sp.]|uniref:hypothetical protein n=1 Tax=Lacipirellula sp. TaxID=2691419 RepID=UPI003D09831E